MIRLLLGCLAVVAASAATSAVFVSGEISSLRDALSQNPSLKLTPGSLAPAGFGSAQTLLLVGDDQRALTKYYHHAVLPHANEMLLVRLDPGKPWISMMSIPRELQTTIYPPNAPPVTTRFNYAYTAGGIPLLLSTIKRALGLSVNHVVVITFGRFRRAVDEMGCVYSTIDRRYYHVNTPTSEQYQEINLQPGYQKLCGDQALQFVSYRHGDTSLVRDSRDQSFLLDVKKQYGSTLAGNIHKFEQISASVHSFLYGGGALPKQRTAAVAHAVQRRQVAAHLPLVPTSSAELAQARAAASGLSFPLEYPRVRDELGSADPISRRTYLIHAPDGTAYPAYVAVVSSGLLGQNYDVQGMTWTTAPQFDSPEQTVRVGGRTYSLYFEADRLKMVVWQEHGAVYWIRNTLLNSVGNGELLAIAEQTEPVRNVAGPGARQRVALSAAGVPLRTSTAPPQGLALTLGSWGGVLTLLALPLVAILLVKRRRDLGLLRQQLRESSAREAQLASALQARSRASSAPPG